MIAPTARQLELVAFWCRATDERGYPPTLREAGAVMHIGSTNGVTDHVNCCVRKGLLRRTADRRNRGIVITDLGRSLVGAAPPQRRLTTATFIVEQRCACGVSFFVEGQTRCAACVRASLFLSSELNTRVSPPCPAVALLLTENRLTDREPQQRTEGV